MDVRINLTCRSFLLNNVISNGPVQGSTGLYFVEYNPYGDDIRTFIFPISDLLFMTFSTGSTQEEEGE